jgi:peptidoglycan/xylan/chitin deacetylase (PgdA/CDA1 family)
MRDRIHWPGANKNAVLITVNLDAEYFATWLYPGVDIKGSDLEAMGQFGVHGGLDRVLQTLKAFDIHATFFVPGRVAEIYPEAIIKIVQDGHEIATHGYAHENMALLSSEEQRHAISDSIDAIERACGIRPKGFRAPEGELTLQTLKIAKELGLTYSSTLANDDLPYFNTIGETEEDTLFEIPIHWALFDLPYFIFHFWPPMPYSQDRISSFRKVLTNWKWEYDIFHEEGLCFVLQIDPITMGDPGRIYMLEQLLSYIQNGNDAWFTTGCEMYEYFKNGKPFLNSSAQDKK